MSKPPLPDDLWAVVEPLLPLEPPRPMGGRPRVPDSAALTGILFVLRSGTPWELLPQEMGCGSGMTCWRRLRDWQQAGVWDRVQRVLLGRLGRRNAIDFRRAALDSASVAAKKGGSATGPNPTDRGEPGTKRHVLTDAQGIPLALTLTGADVPDSMARALLSQQGLVIEGEAGRYAEGEDPAELRRLPERESPFLPKGQRDGSALRFCRSDRRDGPREGGGGGSAGAGQREPDRREAGCEVALCPLSLPDARVEAVVNARLNHLTVWL